MNPAPPPPHHASLSSSHHPTLPNAAPLAKSPRRVGLVVGILAGAAVVSVGAGVGAYLVLRPEPPLVLDERRLPANLVSFGERRTGPALEKTDNARRASSLRYFYFTAICTWDDAPFDDLQGLDTSAAAAERVTSPRWSMGAKATVKCADAMNKAAPGERTATFTASPDGDEKKTLGVTLVPIEIEDFTKLGFLRQSIRGREGYCIPTIAEDGTAETSCRNESHSGYREGKYLVVGTKASLEHFATTLDTPRTELSSQVEYLVAAAKAGVGLTLRLVSKTDKTNTFAFYLQNTACGDHLKPEVLKLCFPPAVREAANKLEAKSEAFLYESDVHGVEAAFAEKFRTRFVFAARSESVAKDIEGEAADLAKDIKSQVDNNEPKLAEKTKHLRDRVDTGSPALFGPRLRALRAFKVTRDGKIVTLSFETDLSEDEKREIKERYLKSYEKFTRNMDLYETIARAGKVPDATLESLAGPKWAKYLNEPRDVLTKTECAKVKRIIDGKCSELTPGSDAYALCGRVDCEREVPLPKAAHACLVTAATRADLAGCRATNRPSEDDYGAPDRDK